MIVAVVPMLMTGPDEKALDEGDLDMTTGKSESDLSFEIMALIFRVRDLITPRMNILKEVGVKPGQRVLDYGCGPGGYIAPLAELVGAEGEIIVLDIHPAAIRKVQRLVKRLGLVNVRTVQSDCATGLPDASVDVALLYDIFHNLRAPDQVLRELHRVLKPDGVLSFSDHHLQEDNILTQVTAGGRFALADRGAKTYTLSKVG